MKITNKAIYSLMLAGSLVFLGQSSYATSATALAKTVGLVKTGLSKGLKKTDIGYYHAMANTEKATVVLVKHATQLADGKEISLLVRRSENEVMDKVTLTFRSKVNAQYTKEINELPGTYAMHGDAGTPGRISIENSGLKLMAYDAVGEITELKLAKLVNINEDGLGSGISSMTNHFKKNKELGIEGEFKGIIVEQFAARRTTQGVESMNNVIVQDSAGTLYNSFSVNLGFGKSASVEEVSAVIEVFMKSIR